MGGNAMLRTGMIYAMAALFEIGGCFAVWMVLRQGASVLWLLVAALALGGFAYLLAQSEQAFAGRAFAAYGGVYVAASILWLWGVEGVLPNRTDLLGGAVVLCGVAVILSGGRG